MNTVIATKKQIEKLKNDSRSDHINEVLSRWRRMRVFKVGKDAEADGFKTGHSEDISKSYEMLKKAASGLDDPAPYRERREKFCRRMGGWPVFEMKICKFWWKGYLEGIEKREMKICKFWWKGYLEGIEKRGDAGA